MNNFAYQIARRPREVRKQYEGLRLKPHAVQARRLRPFE